MRPTFHAGLLSLALATSACEEPAPPGTPSASGSARASSQPAGASASAAPLASQPPAATVSAAPVEPPATDALGRLARGTNAFGLELYGRLRGEPGNLVISPASISTALAMTWGGAQGETAAQMKKVLRLEGPPEEVTSTSGQLLRALESPSRPITFRVANQLFADRSFELLSPFVERTKSAFGAPVERLDFRAGAEPARQHINGWVEAKTERRIKELIPPHGVTEGTPLVLVNALYFQGDWQAPFTKEATSPASFFVTKSDKVEVPTMHQLGAFPYAKQEGVQLLELPYKGGEMSMALLVPEALDGLEALEKSLDAARLAALLGSAKRERVNVALPKFEVAPAATLALAQHLRPMGMVDAFDPAKADFGGISTAGLCIGEVFHKGFVQVDEKGTEAAAASAVVMAPSGPAPAPGLELKIDRPFLFLIRDTKSGLILFMGRVTDPSKR